jgi:hypothetical protein
MLGGADRRNTPDTSASCVLQQLCPELGEPQVAGRPLQQARAELILELRDAAADRRDRHLQTACRFGKAVRLDDSGEHHQRVEIRHRLSIAGKFIPSFAI